MKKPTKMTLAFGLLFTACELATVYFAVLGYKAAENIISFWSILAGLCGFLLLLCFTEAVKAHVKKPRIYNAIITVGDIVIIAAIASQGWFWAASFFFVGFFVPQCVRLSVKQTN